MVGLREASVSRGIAAQALGPEIGLLANMQKVVWLSYLTQPQQVPGLSEGPCLKRIRQNRMEMDTRCLPLASAHMCTCVYSVQLKKLFIFKGEEQMRKTPDINLWQCSGT